MVELMESWFLADLKALREFFRNRVPEDALRGNPKVEIPKLDVLSRLEQASGGQYHKTKHAPAILAEIDPARVRKAAPNCERMFRALLDELSKD